MFYVTFGVQYAYQEHPSSRFVDPNGVVEVKAESLDEAIGIVQDHFDRKYSSVYETNDSNSIFEYYPRGIIGVASKGNMIWLDQISS